jgi:hypothetical protein
MREEEITAHRLAAFSDAVFAVIVTHMVSGTQGAGSAGILGPLAAPTTDMMDSSGYSTMWAMGAYSFRLSISIKLTDHDLFVWK